MPIDEIGTMEVDTGTPTEDVTNVLGLVTEDPEKRCRTYTCGNKATMIVKARPTGNMIGNRTIEIPSCRECFENAARKDQWEILKHRTVE